MALSSAWFATSLVNSHLSFVVLQLLKCFIVASTFALHVVSGVCYRNILLFESRLVLLSPMSLLHVRFQRCFVNGHPVKFVKSASLSMTYLF